MKGLNIQDDRVMSLIWALMILETDITEQYFEIVERDKNNKPSRIKSLDYGEKYFSRTISLYNDENPLNDYSALPLYIDSQTLPGQADGTGNRHDGDITSLQEQGWELI
jgi:hypothetical protein